MHVFFAVRAPFHPAECERGCTNCNHPALVPSRALPPCGLDAPSVVRPVCVRVRPEGPVNVYRHALPELLQAGCVFVPPSHQTYAMMASFIYVCMLGCNRRAHSAAPCCSTLQTPHLQREVCRLAGQVCCACSVAGRRQTCVLSTLLVGPRAGVLLVFQVVGRLDSRRWRLGGGGRDGILEEEASGFDAKRRGGWMFLKEDAFGCEAASATQAVAEATGEAPGADRRSDADQWPGCAGAWPGFALSSLQYLF